MTMKIYGLIGYPLTHSFSKPYFTEKFVNENLTDCSYENYPIASIEDIKQVFSNSAIKGLNVTIPYKEDVIPYLDGLSHEAKIIGAVNTIKRVGDSWIGYNTDYYGFRRSWESVLTTKHQKALVLGTGGAAKAVWYVLQQKQMPFLKVSRKNTIDTISYAEITPEILEDYTAIVNTTPLGMYPNIQDSPPIPYALLSERHYLYDLVYNPIKTKFLQLGERKGATIKAGIDMLYYQADKAWEIWNS